jgi:hypothetical protein
MMMLALPCYKNIYYEKNDDKKREKEDSPL